jgi:hypothetical protein
MLRSSILRRSVAAATLAGLLLAAACAGGSDGADTGASATEGEPTTTPTTEATTTSRPSQPRDTTTTTEANPFARPNWLGTRPLPLRPDGLGEAQPTPPELTDRRLATPSDLPPPPDEAFHSHTTAVPEDVATRSTWRPECPVGLDDLRYVTVSFWGFDGDHHSGELLIHASAAEAIVGVFARLHEVRFPIEELRITRAEEVDAHPTGDGNLSGGFVCRSAVQTNSWSQHAYGLAVDINPFHNPYVRGDAVVPELASAYLDRDNVRPGMLTPGDVVTQAFADIGWGWGGNWSTAKDWMHFSASGR